MSVKSKKKNPDQAISGRESDHPVIQANFDPVLSMLTTVLNPDDDNDETDPFLEVENKEKHRLKAAGKKVLDIMNDDIITAYLDNNFGFTEALDWRREGVRSRVEKHLLNRAINTPGVDLMTYIDTWDDSCAIADEFISTSSHKRIFNKALSQDLSFGEFILSDPDRKSTGIPQFFMLHAKKVMATATINGELFYEKNPEGRTDLHAKIRPHGVGDHDFIPILRLSRIALIMDLMDDDLPEVASDLSTIRYLLSSQDININDHSLYSKVIAFLERRSAQRDLEDHQLIVTHMIPEKAMVTLIQEREGMEPLEYRYKSLSQPMAIRAAVSGKNNEERLHHEFPWMQHITRAIFREITSNQRFNDNGFLFKPILLVGEAGCGKTRYAQRLAEIVDIPSRIITIGGSSDNRSIAGSARAWGNSRPSLIVSLITEELTPNPIVILDEIEKVGASRRNGNIHDTLLQLLEPFNASRFFDEYLISKVDLSGVNYIATANSVNELPSPLKDRFMILKVPMPTYDQMIGVAHGIWANHWAKAKLPPEMTPVLDDELLTSVVPRNAASLRKVKKVMDIIIRNMMNDIPIMQPH